VVHFFGVRKKSCVNGSFTTDIFPVSASGKTA
jgi:hypothetical protein